MEKITPVDIEQRQFNVSFRGFDRKEVDTFMDEVVQSLEEMIRENNMLKEEIDQLKKELQGFENKEKTLNEAICSINRIAEEIKANAEREAELILKNAEAEGEKQIYEANQRIAKLKDEIYELRKQRILFESGLKSLIRTHEDLLSKAFGGELSEDSLPPD